MTGETSIDLSIEDQMKLKAIRQRTMELAKDLEEINSEMQGYNTEIDQLERFIKKNDPEVKKFIGGIKKFNVDAKKGLEYLFENGLLKRTPLDVAQFFYKEEGLNKKIMGDYMGEISKEFNLKVLEEYTGLYNFSGLDLLQSFRKYLMGFYLPGESQKIEKIVNIFSERYYSQNSGDFVSEEAVGVLTYAMIVLNTSFHNPNVKPEHNPFKEEKDFVAMNKSYDQMSFPDSLLRTIYQEIRAKPFKGVLETVKEGWLWKLGGRVKNWKRRYFVLEDQCLFYYVTSDRTQNKGMIPLENVRIRKVQDKSKENCFEIFSSGNNTIKACKTDKEGVIVAGKHSIYRMSANTPIECDDWFKEIEKIIDRFELENCGHNSSLNTL